MADWKVTELEPGKFPAAADPAGRELLAKWSWFNLVPIPTQGGWRGQIVAVRTAINSLVPRLKGTGSAAWICLYGPFLPNGILGAAARLVDGKLGLPFFLSETQRVAPGRGYVETLFGVEWGADVFDRLFVASETARAGILPCNCRVSVILGPEARIISLGKCGVFSIDLYAQRLPESSLAVLAEAAHVMLPNLDFDAFLVGSQNEHAAEIRQHLVELGVR